MSTTPSNNKKKKATHHKGGPKSRNDFEGKDLSFGKKNKPKTRDKNEKKKTGVTFHKSIDDKRENTSAHHQKKSNNFKPQQKRHLRKKGFKRHFDLEKEGEKVYTGGKHYQKKPKDWKDNYYKSDTDDMPLNKYIAHCGICSRREAANLVKSGKIKVNGKLMETPGYRVMPKDKVYFKGNLLKLQQNLVYILLNKPKNHITTTDDPKGRRTVLDIFKNKIDERIYPVGRLDRNTTGLLLLTNDGDLAQKLAHPTYEIKKVYQVDLTENLKSSDFDKIKNGINLKDGVAQVDKLAYLDSHKEIGLEIHSGKNRIVRRIFESMGYKVKRLDRVVYAGLTKKNVPRGTWRYLSKQEVINLKHLNG